MSLAELIELDNKEDKTAKDWEAWWAIMDDFNSRKPLPVEIENYLIARILSTFED